MAGLSEITGVLVVDKPSGPTSHDVVARARRLYSTRQVGHAGTLDPMATGVLVLLFGEATKLSAHLTADDKTYRAELSFGTSTDTLDAEGRVTEERVLEPGWLDRGALERALAEERERIEQIPPAVSAIKVGGVRAHKVARRGETPELLPRTVRVERLDLLEHDERHASLELTVSKGYYVRSLARDIGLRLGVPLHLAKLRRLASGSFTEAEAATWPPAAALELIDLPTAVRRALPVAQLSTEGERRARTGLLLGPEHFSVAPEPGTVSAWLSADGRVVALGEKRGEDAYAVLRGFRP